MAWPMFFLILNLFLLITILKPFSLNMLIYFLCLTQLVYLIYLKEICIFLDEISKPVESMASLLINLDLC